MPDKTNIYASLHEQINIYMPFWRHQLSHSDFKQRSIVITGATGIIGSTLAYIFAMHGAELILISKSEQKLNALQETIYQDTKQLPITITCDFSQTNETTWDTMADIIERQSQTVNCLVHTAYHTVTRLPFSFYSQKMWLASMQVNLHAPVLLTKSLLPLMPTDQHNAVITTKLFNTDAQPAYWGSLAVASSALSAWSNMLSQEFEHTSQIRFNQVDFSSTNLPHLQKAIYSEPSTHTDTSPHQIARYLDTILFLASTKGSSTSGLCIDAKTWQPNTATSTPVSTT